VDAARSDPLTPRARAVARAVQRREQEWATRRKERRIRRQEHREQESEEYRLHEQQGLPPPPRRRRRTHRRRRRRKRATGGGPLPRGGIPHPCHHELRRRPPRECPRRAWRRLLWGHQWRRPRAPRGCRRARLGRPLNPRGRGSGASPA
jgi:hypothetical protein